MQAFLLLAFGRHADANLVQGVGGSAFIFAGYLNSRFGFAARDAAGIQGTRGFGNDGFEFSELGQTAAKGFFDGCGFALE